MKRRVRTHIKPLILFLKDNVQRCLSQTHSKRVCFVPFCPGYVAADVFDMSQVLKIAARRAGVFTSRDRCQRSQRVLAACALTTCFFTVRGAQAVGAPPVPLTATYKAKLKTAILATRREGVQVFNTAVLALASKSILQLDELCARQRVDTLVAEMETVVRNIRRWFRDGQTSRSSSAHGPCHCQPQLEMLQALACKGMPRLGYLQNLMCCLYKYGNFPGVDRLEWPCFYEFPNIGTGCAASITHLTGSDEVCVCQIDL